ncbi:hypothetical protein LJC20_00445 [Eubacteriales bacterium OttesenSCG-928-M02]|nr:hypothetical protein [Eubacteriales bacterium OttesenSCG-928-M02]
MAVDNEVRKYLDWIKNAPEEIGHYLGFEDLTLLHRGWLQAMMFSEADETLQAHRGSYKTSCLAIAMALMMLIRPNRNIIFLRKTDDDVKEVIRQVIKILESEVISHLVQKIYGVSLSLLEATASAVTTNLVTDIRGRSQLQGLGIKASLTGKHADIVITDDIVNIRDRVSRAEREATKIAYQELQNIKNRGGRIFNTGTPWHKEDAFSIMPNAKKYDCYNTDLISREELEELRQSMSPSLFAANYELQHIADSEALFTSPSFTSATETIFGGVGHIDAAYGGADGTAFTILKQQGDKLVMFGKKWPKHVDDCLDEIYSYMDYYRAGSIYMEKNADKGYLSNAISKAGRPTNPYTESMNKFIKISTHLRKRWVDILWLEDTDPEYINEILDYTEHSERDDCPDSAASIIREVTGKRGWLI